MSNRAAQGRHRADRLARRNIAARCADESGVVAVITAIVVAAVLVPLTALGLFAYTRSGTLGELKRAADSGALAGAALIPLGNVAFVNGYVNQVSPTAGALSSSVLASAGITLGSPNDPLIAACNVARSAAAASAGLSSEFVQTTPAGSSLQAIEADIHCHADYIPDSDFLTRISGCVASVLNPTPAQVLNPLLPELQSILPALLHPGVKVTLNWSVRGPIDSVISGSSSTYSNQTTVSGALRRFKNVLLVPGVTVGGVTTPELGAAISGTTSTAFTALESVDSTLSTGINSLLSTVGLSALNCGAILTAFQSDYDDVVDPTDGSHDTPAQTVSEVEGTGGTVLELQFPPTGTLPVIGAPFFNFVQVCIPPYTAVMTIVQNAVGTAQCAVTAPSAFRSQLVDVTT